MYHVYKLTLSLSYRKETSLQLQLIQRCDITVLLQCSDTDRKSSSGHLYPV